MKHPNPLKLTMTQFAYNHKNLDARFRKLRKSAEEAAGTLEKLGQKEQKEEEK